MTSALRARLRVYVIIDPAWCAAPDGSPRSPLEVARGALAGGATCLQLRAKGEASDRARLELCRALCEAAHAAGAWLLVNDRVDLAHAAGADGVHLGPDDLPLEAARELLGPGRVLGASAASPERARAAEAAGADYLGVGALYEARAIKANASAPRGAPWLREMCAATRLPLVGIGGIGLDNAAEVIAAGAAGVAVVRAVCSAPDPAAATRALAEAVARGAAAPL